MSRTRLIVSAILIVILGLIAVPATWASGLKHPTPPTSFTVGLAAGAGGDAVLLVDLNNDGKNDLVVAECSLTQIEIFQGDGSGGFTLKKTIPITNGVVSSCPQALAYGKVTGGTFNDIVVGDNGGNITVIPNDGTLTFPTAPVVQNLSGTANVTGVAVADMDGDGKLDVVAASGEVAGKVYILLGNALVAWVGTATAGSPYTVGSFPDAVVVADFNGDGEQDLATANFSAGTVSILTNNTAGYPNPAVTFSSATSTIATASPSPVAIAAGTVGTSGKPDLVVANKAGQTVSVLLNDGTGAFPATTTDTAVSGKPTGIGLGDFNTDGKNDIIVSAADGADILFNSGTGTFAGPSVNFPTAVGSFPNGISVAPINGDTWIDAAVVDNSLDSVYVFLGTPFSAVTPVAVSGVEGLALANPTTLLTFKYDNSPAVTQFNNPPATTQVTDWGDLPLNTSIPNVTGPDVNGVYTVQDLGTKTYAEQGSFNISLTVNNNTDGQSYVITPSTTPASQAATIADAPLAPAATSDLPDAAPPQTYTNVTVANFTDQNPGAPQTDFSASIDWGDCGATTNTHNSGPGPCSAALVAGTVGAPVGGIFPVTGTAPAAVTTVGVYTVVTTITDVEGGSTQTTTVTIHYNITTMTVAAAVAGAATEGASTSPTVATITSTTTDNASNFSALIDWGDCGLNNTPGACPGGSQTVGSITAGAGNKCQTGCTVSGTHTYKYGAAAGTAFQVVVYATDSADGSIANDSSAPMTLTVSDAALSAAVAQPANILVNEGSVLTGLQTVANFKDNNPLAAVGDFTGVTVFWHDFNGTSSPGTVTGGPTNFSITATPQVNTLYKEEGNVTITFNVTDSGGGLAGNSLTGSNGAVVQVNDAPLTAPTNAPISIGTPTPLVEGVDAYNGSLGTFSDGNPTAPLNDFDNPSGGGALNIAGSYVDWGDGVQENCTSNAGTTPHCVIGGAAPNFTVTGSHASFQAAGTLSVVVHIVDVGGSTGTINNITATVTSLGSPVTKQVPGALEGVAFASPQALLDFTSHRVGAVASDFAVAGTTVNWADGTPIDTGAGANLTVSGAAGSFTLNGVHTYSEETPSAAICGNLAACQLTITIKDKIDGSTLTVGPAAFPTGSTVAVGDAPIAAVAAAPLGTVSESNVAQINNQIVAYFTDQNPFAPATDFNAAAPPALGSISVDWGDGNTSTGTAALEGSGCVTTPAPAGPPFTTQACAAGLYRLFHVTATHTYTEGGKDLSGPGCGAGGVNPALCTIKVTIKDIGGSSVTNFSGTSVQVQDAVLTNPVVSNISGGGSGPGGKLIANVDTWTGALATFTDGNAGAPAADFDNPNGGGALNVAGSYVDWGDGQQENCTSSAVTTPNCVIAAAGGGSFSVTGKHIFVKAGAALGVVTVKITDVGGAPQVSGSSALAPVVGTLYNPVAVNVNATQGSVFTGVVGDFNLSIAADTTTATITWADPNCNDLSPDVNVHCTSAGTIALVGGSTYSVTGSHNYAAPGSPAITVAVNDTTAPDGPLSISGGTNTVTVSALTPGALVPAGPVNEGTALPGTTVVLNFTDANTLGPQCPGASCNYVATVDWGDGTAPVVGATITGGPGNGTNPTAYTVTGGHTYTEGGLDPLNPTPAGQCVPAPGAGQPAVCHVRVTITKGGGPTAITLYNGADASVNDAPLGAVAVNNVAGGGSGIGGKLVATVDDWNSGMTLVLATFTDTNTGAAASDFTAVIQWGDTTSTNCPAAGCVISATGPGAFQIVANHTFTKAGAALAVIQVTVTDKGGAPPVSGSSPLPAVVGTLYNSTPVPVNGSEGVVFTANVGEFNLSIAADTTTATINWNDPKCNNALPNQHCTDPGVIALVGGSTYSVTGTHKYAEEGAYSIVTSVNDTTAPDGTLTITSPATVAPGTLTPIAQPTLPAQNEPAAESGVTVLAYTDTNTLSGPCPGATCDFVATIDWGDGTAPTTGIVTGAQGGPYTVTGSHTYTEGGVDVTGACTPGTPAIPGPQTPGVCHILVTVTDDGAATPITNFHGTDAPVNDAPLTGAGVGTLAPATTTVSGVLLATFKDGNLSAPLSDFTASVDWGDGKITAGTVSGSAGNFSVTGTHTYTTLGTLFKVTITVNDKGGSAVVIANQTSILTPATGGADFVGAVSPPVSQITAGQALDVVLTLSPQPPPTGGFNQEVHFLGCTILPGSPAGPITCSFNPSFVPNVNLVYTVHVTVQTFGAAAHLSTPPLPGRSNPIQLALLLPGFVGVFGMVLLGGTKNGRRRTILWFGASLLLLALLLVGCGGGGAQITPASAGGGTAPGLYNLQVQTDDANAPAMIIQVKVQ